MNEYKKGDKKPPFFESWNYKHQSNEGNLSIIAGRNVDEHGAGACSIQIITESNTFSVTYPLSEFRFLKHRLAFKIGGNYFTDKGVFLDIIGGNFTLKGKLTYGAFTPLKYAAMGPLAYLSRQEYRLDVISMSHRADGRITLNGKVISFSGGYGFISKNSGRSYPEKFTWLQGIDKSGTSVLAASGKMSFLNREYMGVLCIVSFLGNQHRITSYFGGRFEQENSCRYLFLQGSKQLEVTFNRGNCEKILAPVNGNMSRVITASEGNFARFVFSQNDRTVFDFFTTNCSYAASAKKSDNEKC